MAASDSTKKKAAARKPRPVAKKTARKPPQTTAAAAGGNTIRIPPRGELVAVSALEFYEKEVWPESASASAGKFGGDSPGD